MTVFRPAIPATLLLVLVTVAAIPAEAAGQRLQQLREASRQPARHAPALPPGTRVLHEVAYGDDPRQRFDVYLPPQTRDAPVVLFVHGGGWANGNKDAPRAIEGKAGDWLPKGYVLVSTNYRLVPDADPLAQARDVARALAEVQRSARSWGADPARVLLAGHSAGAHLAALVGATDALWRAAGARPPRGVLALDSGVLDVPEMMRRPRLPSLYGQAFGDDPGDWAAVSPQHRLDRHAVPMLLVCSTRRRDACPQARALQRKAATLRVPMEVLPVDLAHGDLNRELGQPSAYTRAVDRWLDARLR